MSLEQSIDALAVAITALANAVNGSAVTPNGDTPKRGRPAKTKEADPVPAAPLDVPPAAPEAPAAAAPTPPPAEAPAVVAAKPIERGDVLQIAMQFVAAHSNAAQGQGKFIDFLAARGFRKVSEIPTEKLGEIAEELRKAIKKAA